MSGQNLFANMQQNQQHKATATTNNFQMEAQVGRHGELLGLEQSSTYLFAVEGAKLNLVNMSADVLYTVHSWGLNQITGWQAIDGQEFMLVIPQGKVSFFVEDAHVLASFIEDACVQYAKQLKLLKQQQQQYQQAPQNVQQYSSPPPPPHPAMQQQQQQPLQQQMPNTVSIIIPKGVKPGNKIKIKLDDGTMREFTVPKGAKAGSKVEMSVRAEI